VDGEGSSPGLVGAMMRLMGGYLGCDERVVHHGDQQVEQQHAREQRVRQVKADEGGELDVLERPKAGVGGCVAARDRGSQDLEQLRRVGGQAVGELVLGGLAEDRELSELVERRDEAVVVGVVGNGVLADARVGDVGGEAVRAEEDEREQKEDGDVA